MVASPEASVPRYVGAAFIAQFCTSLAAGMLSSSLLSGEVGDVVAGAHTDATRLRVVILLELLTSIGIMALASLLYVALRDTVRGVATVAWALWLAEAMVLAVSMLGLSALLDLGARSGGAGTSLAVSDAAVARLGLGLHEQGADIAMFFFCAGALLWYSLFIRTRFVPRWLGVWGLTAAVLVCAATLINVWNTDVRASMLLYVAYIPYELVVGIWLLVKGSPVRSGTVDVTTSGSLTPTDQPTPTLTGTEHPSGATRYPAPPMS